MIDINYPLTYENAFNGDVSSNNKKIRILIDCLKKLNKDESIIKCSQVNFALFKDSDEFALKEPDKISEELTAYFPPQSIKRIKWFISKKRKKNISSNFIAFWRGQITNMIFYILQHCPTNEGYKLTDADFNENFSKSALLIGELLNNEDTEGQYPNTGDLYNDCIKCLLAVKCGLENANHISQNLLFNQIYRGYTIFVKLLSKKTVPNKDSIKFDQYFLEHFKISLYDCYLYILSLITHLIYNKESQNNFIINRETVYKNITSKKVYKDFDQLIGLLSQDLTELTNQIHNKSKIDFKRLLRAKPIIQLPENLLVISDVTYLVDDFVSKGPRFFLSKLPETKDVHTIYGECFENYVCTLLEQRHKSGKFQSNIKLSSNNKKDEIEVDAYVELDDNVKVIYEIKAVLINESKDLESEITEKYLNKAIPQLCKRIKFFKNIASTNTIYPVLIVEDEFISKCEFWFKSELEKQLASNSAEIAKIVYPLIIISVQTLELLPITVDLFSILKEYHNGTFSKPNIGANFCDYILSPHYKYGTYTSPEAAELVEKLLLSVKEKMFKTVIS